MQSSQNLRRTIYFGICVLWTTVIGAADIRNKTSSFCVDSRNYAFLIFMIFPWLVILFSLILGPVSGSWTAIEFRWYTLRMQKFLTNFFMTADSVDHMRPCAAVWRARLWLISRVVLFRDLKSKKQILKNCGKLCWRLQQKARWWAAQLTWVNALSLLYKNKCW